METGYRYPQGPTAPSTLGYGPSMLTMQGTSPYQPAAPSGQGMQQQWSPATPTKEKKPSNILSIVALVVAIVAIVAAVVMSIVYATMAYGKSGNVWVLIQGSTGKTADNFTPEPSDLYISNATAPMTLNIMKPGKSLEGRLFFVDNTRSPARLTVMSNELTAVDNVNDGKVEAHTTAIYLGISDSSFERLI